MTIIFKRKQHKRELTREALIAKRISNSFSAVRDKNSIRVKYSSQITKPRFRNFYIH